MLEVSSIQSRPVIPRSNSPSATYSGISWGRRMRTSETRGSSIGGPVVDVRAALDGEVGVREQLEGGPFERALGQDESQHRAGRSLRSSGGRARRLTISIAVQAASKPLLPALVPARSTACSMVSVVSTPNTTGIPLSSCTRWTPAAHWPATKS